MLKRVVRFEGQVLVGMRGKHGWFAVNLSFNGELDGRVDTVKVLSEDINVRFFQNYNCIIYIAPQKITLTGDMLMASSSKASIKDIGSQWITR